MLDEIDHFYVSIGQQQANGSGFAKRNGRLCMVSQMDFYNICKYITLSQ